MTRTRIALAATVVALVAAAPSQAALPKLAAVVGPGFNITLKSGGKAVKTLKAGKYSLTISDKSGIHNFHLTGPGVNVDSGVSRQGTKTYTITLKRGKYTFVCTPHLTLMKGSFTVT